MDLCVPQQQEAIIVPVLFTEPAEVESETGEQYNDTEAVVIAIDHDKINEVTKEFVAQAPPGVIERDAALIQRIKAGDEQAFQELWGHYVNLVFRIALCILHNYDDADEAVNDIAMRMLKALDVFDPSRFMVPWLCKLAKNHCINVWKKVHAHPMASVEDENPTDNGNTTPHDIYYNVTRSAFGYNEEPRNAHENVIREELCGRIRRCLDRLPKKYREILYLRYIEDYSYEEIRVTLGMASGTVMSRLHKARIAAGKEWAEMNGIEYVPPVKTPKRKRKAKAGAEDANDEATETQYDEAEEVFEEAAV